MLVAKLTVGYQAGVKFNVAKDITEDKESEEKVLGVGSETKDGKVIRGLGTHFESKEAYEKSKELHRESCRVRGAFAERFVTTPLDSLYVVQDRYEAQKFLGSLEPKGIRAHVMVFNLTSVGGSSMDDVAMSEWVERVKNQFARVKLGRGKETDEDGLRTLETLAKCPVISKETRERVVSMIGSVRLKNMDKDEFRRKIETLDVKIDQEALSPRRAPVSEEAVA